jgi:urease accessory protein
MIPRAIVIVTADQFAGLVAERNPFFADTVVLDFDARSKRRIVMEGIGGTRFLLDLPRPQRMRNADALQLEDGRLIEILAAPETLIEIRVRDAGHLARLAWHLGNRHLPVEIGARFLRTREDAVIAEMIRGLGGTIRTISAPFEPEGGAYAADSPAAGHSHAHSHSHAHAHSHA